MNKKLSAVKLFALLFLTVVLLASVFTGIPLSKVTGVYDMIPLTKLINYGFEFRNGTEYVVNIKDNAGDDEALKSISGIIKSRLKIYGLENYSVSVKDNEIHIIVGEIINKEEFEDYLTKVGYISFQNTDGEILLDGKSIASANATSYYYSDDKIYPAVAVTMSAEGTELLSDVTTQYFYQTINIKVDDDTISSPQISSTITNGQMYLAVLSTDREASLLAGLVNCGALPFGIEIVSAENVSSLLAASSVNIMKYTALGVFAFLVALYLIFYRKAGITSAFCNTIFACLTIIFVSITAIKCDFFEIAACVVIYAVFCFYTMVFLKTTKKQAAIGKTINAALESALKLTKKTLIIICGALFTIGAVLFCIQIDLFVGASYTFIFGSVLMLLVSLIFRKTLKASYSLIGNGKTTFIGVK